MREKKVNRDSRPRDWKNLCRPVGKGARFAFLVPGTMAVALSPNELDRTIAVLASAGQTLQLTRLERLSYRALLVSVDGMLVSFVLICPISFLIRYPFSPDVKALWTLLLILVAVFALSMSAGTYSLLLNIPLLVKTFREGKRLERLGLNSLSISLWKESRRSRWTSRIREVLSIGFVISMLFIMVGAFGLLGGSLMESTDLLDRIILAFGMLSPVLIAGLMLAARYLRNQRERMDLAASAEQLSKALLSLRQREGPEVVSVPADLLEQTAIIESAQIKKERKDAVLQSEAFRQSAYAIGFDREAAQQRTALGVADRVELEDLVAELSTNGAQLETRTPLEAAPETLRGATKSKRVEIEYVIDRASRGIRVIAVRHGAEAAGTPANGAGHG
jgi:hypothetical protein